MATFHGLGTVTQALPRNKHGRKELHKLTCFFEIRDGFIKTELDACSTTDQELAPVCG